jgi:CBS domain-containing protein
VEEAEAEMRTKDIMSSPAVTVTPETHLKDAARLLVERGISAVPVVDAQGALVGIVSEADLVPLEAAPDPRAHAIPVPHSRRRVPHTVSEIMTRDVVVLPGDADAAEAARLMLRRHIKRIPIVSGDRVVGIVSRRDLLRILARRDEEIAAELGDLVDDDALMLGHFRVSVNDGVVTLAGPHDRSSRRLAELLARSVPGVIGVSFAGRPARAARTG